MNYLELIENRDQLKAGCYGQVTKPMGKLSLGERMLEHLLKSESKDHADDGDLIAIGT